MGVTFESLCGKGTQRQVNVTRASDDVRDAIRKLQAAEDADYPTNTLRENLIRLRDKRKRAEIELQRHVAHCTDGCKRAPDGGFGARATQTGAYSRSPSHKDPMPGGGELAARIRAGETLADLAAEFDRTPSRVSTLLNEAGFSARTGEPNAKARRVLLGFVRVEDQPWADDALCAQTDPEAFYPEKGGSTREAKAVCAGCLVQAECLDFALDHDERFGIWGGLSERERRKIKRRSTQPPEPIAPGRHLSGLTCALDGCANPTTRGDTGAPRKYCTPEHKHQADAQPPYTQEKSA